MINEDDKKQISLTEKKNLQYLNLFRVFVSLFFYVLVERNPLGIDFKQQFHVWVSFSVAAYMSFSLLMLVVSVALNQTKAIKISKVALFIDVIVIIYLAFGISAIDQGLGYLPLLAIGSSAILFRKTFNILLAPTFAALLLWYMPDIIQLPAESKIRTSSFLIHILSYYVMALLGIRQSISYTSTLKLYNNQSLRVSGLENLNQIVIEKLKNGVVIYQDDFVILHANESAKKLLGIEDNIFVPESIKELFKKSSDGSVLETVNGNDVFLRKAVIDPTNNFNILFIEDSKYLKKTAQQLNLASLGKLSSSIAHEIRNPLTAINTAAELLAESPTLAGEDKQLCTIIINQTKRTNNIIEDILSMSKRKNAKLESINLNEYFVNFKHKFCAAQKIKKSQMDLIVNKNKTILFDLSHLGQIAWNLCTNILKHGDDKHIQIIIHDDYIDFKNIGEDFSDTKKKELFEPFFTTHSRGTGLGLHLCRELCHANNANLIYQHANNYTIFRVQLNNP